MPGKLACPHCHAPLAADPDLVGTTIRCYLCAKEFPILVGPEALVTSELSPPPTVIDVIESYLNEPFDIDAADRLAEVPTDHLQDLLHSLAQFYGDWLENEVEYRWHTTDSNDFHLFNPYPRDYAAEEHLEQCKKLLFYLPRLTWHDPLADELIPIFTVWQLEVGVEENQLREALKRGLQALALLAPLIRKGDVTLIPQASVLNYTIVQLRTQEELARISPQERTELLNRFGTAARRTNTDHPFGTEHVFEASKVWGHFCSLMRMSPVACDPLIHEILKTEYEQEKFIKSRVPQITHRVATSLYQFSLPGISSLPLDEVLRLRENVGAFHEWRLGIESFMEHVNQEAPHDSAQTQVELQHAGNAILRPKLEALKKEIKGSSVLEKIFIPGAVAASSMMLTWHYTGNPAVSTGISGLLTTGAWVLDKIRHRFLSKTRKAAAVTEVYNAMLTLDP